jgi:hypothetical protein
MNKSQLNANSTTNKLSINNNSISICDDIRIAKAKDYFGPF